MVKRLVICADGTWNRPEEDLKNDIPTNVLRLARAVKPVARDGASQQVFYDWGVGSSHSKMSAGMTGAGIQKNIQDNYRYIVQNYSPGDEIYLFGFSRGAYTVRSLSGLINNCGILKREHANLTAKAFRHYKNGRTGYEPGGEHSVDFRAKYSHRSRKVKFIGVWDTVGALGVPVSFFGLFDKEDLFYDSKLGSNVEFARHALAIDEQREDFVPTIWKPRSSVDLKQVWFVGSHGDVGGGYKPDSKDGSTLSDIPLAWMLKEARAVGLDLETFLKQSLTANALSKKNNSRKGIYRMRGKNLRAIDHGCGEVLLHQSVADRWAGRRNYSRNAKNLREYMHRLEAAEESLPVTS